MYFTLKPHIILLALALTIAPATFAESNATSASILVKIADGINKLYAHSKAATEANLEIAKQTLYEKTYGLAETVAANSSKKISEPPSINKLIENKLTITNEKRLPVILASMKGSDFIFNPGQYKMNIFGEDKSELANPADMAFNFNALVAPATDVSNVTSGFGYPKKVFDYSELADYYVSLLAGIDTPAVVKPSPNVSYNPNLIAYLVSARQYIAQQSVGLGNIQMILNQYKPVKDLAKTANLPNHNSPDASSAEVDDYMAKKRISDIEWYKKMEAAPPATLARETLYVLAEMRYEMHQNRLLQERILAAVSANQLQNLDAKAKELATKKEDLISKKIIKRD